MAVIRKPMSKKLRFEVFKRDSFTCQYCGKSAPDVILHVDHINPVKRGGKNDILNLITSCVDCNLGKGARELSDDSVVSKQVQQLQDINERREQIELMLKWRDSMANLQDVQAKAIVDAFDAGTGFSDKGSGLQLAKKWMKKYPMEEIFEAIDLSKANYLIMNEDKYTSDSVNKAWDYVPRICACRRIEKENPSIKELNYIRGIVRNRCGYFIPHVCSDILRDALDAGATIDDMTWVAKRCSSWTDWKNGMDSIMPMEGV